MKIKDSREVAYLKNLPPELAKNSFWTTNHATFPKSFGSKPRDVNVFPKDEPYGIEKNFDKWEGTDKNYSIHGRIPIESTWGRHQHPPSPSKYDPKHTVLSRRENEPSISILDRHGHKDQEYTETVNLAQTHKQPEFLVNMETKKLREQHTLLKKSFNTTKLKEVAKLRKPPSELQKINIEDMRKSLLPGPCSYQVEGKLDLLDRYEREPKALLPRREPSCRPRLVLNKETLTLRTDDTTMLQSLGSYYPNADLVHRHFPSYSLGEKRPILQQKQQLTPGPGDYCQDQVLQLGNERMMSTKDHLQITKPIGSIPQKYFATSKHRRKCMF